MEIGDYLQLHGNITGKELNQLLQLQRESMPNIGECAQQLSYINKIQNISILYEQYKTGVNYRTAAKRLRLLNEEQIQILLTFQQESTPNLEEIILEQSIMSRKSLALQLHNYVRDTVK